MRSAPRRGESSLGHTSASPANHRPEPSRKEDRAWMLSHQVKTGTRTDPWYLDSAATSHMTNCRDVFTFMRQIRGTVAVADGRQLASLGQGTIRIRFGGEWVQVHQVLYVPGLQGNLLSVGQLAEKGIMCLFSSQGAV